MKKYPKKFMCINGWERLFAFAIILDGGKYVSYENALIILNQDRLELIETQIEDT